MLQKFDDFFQIRKNVIFKTAQFNQHAQGETNYRAVHHLYSLATDCEFGELKEQLIRDRIIVGIRDSLLSARLQMDPDLTLEKAKRVVCQQEAVRGQQAILNKPEGEISVQAFISRKPAKKSGNTQSQRPQDTTPRPQPGSWSQKCSYCGKGPHPKQAAPSDT